jgi:hypothetical protein
MTLHPNESALHDYLACMDAADFSAALAMFADSVVYIRPATSATAGSTPMPMLRIEGRDAVAASWKGRGKREIRHDIQYVATAGTETFIEGEATIDGRPPVPFLCHATFDGAGRITRFIAIR